MKIKKKFFDLFGMYIEKKTQKNDVSKIMLSSPRFIGERYDPIWFDFFDRL